jgi:predicted nucleic acid-binding protein
LLPVAMITIDTNILAYLFLSTTETAQVEAILARDPVWIAPPLWRSELRNALTLYIRRSLLSLDEAQQIMTDAEQFMQGSDVAVASAHILMLAAHSGCSAYDCEFVAVAQQMGVLLVTGDRELVKRFPGLAMTPQEFLTHTG